MYTILIEINFAIYTTIISHTHTWKVLNRPCVTTMLKRDLQLPGDKGS